MRPSDGMASKSGSVTRWELVGKNQQQESRLTIKLLQSLYNREPIWERYMCRSLEVHSHFIISGVNVCAIFVVAAHRNVMHGEETVKCEVNIYRDKFPVLVRIGKV